MASDDTELIRRWQQGDNAAFEALVRRWQRPVARFLHRLLGEPEQVHDLCQEVFLRLYLAAPRYREIGAFPTWLFRIALNAARDAARRARRNPLPLGDEELPGQIQEADMLCQDQEVLQLLEKAIADLPETQRVVLLLHHYEQLSFEQIARLTGTSASTLKSRFAAALTGLRVRLRELGWTPEEADR